MKEENIDIFFPVPRYEGLYSISRSGIIKSLKRFDGRKTVPERIKLQTILNTGYKSVSLYKRNKNRTTLVHRILAEVFLPNFKHSLEVDHVNGDRSDNTLSNLRLCSRLQNSRNTKKCVQEKSSRFKGVSYKKDKKKWKAYINVNGKQIHLGYFDCELEASKIYDEAACKYYGDYAKTNNKQGIK